MSETRDEIYRLLEAKMLKYSDYADIPVIEAEEEALFEGLRSQGVLQVEHSDADMAEYTGDVIYVRRPLVDMLYWAGQELKNLDRSLTLKVIYGYRSLELQTQLFEQAKATLAEDHSSPDELIEATHRRTAVPSVAGRPTGGAVGVDVLRGGRPVDMGTAILDSSRDSFTFSPFISREAWENRQLLRRAMMSAGFAPYDGEWWHFSYGDKEWARYHRKPGALYAQVSLADAHKIDTSGSVR